MSGPAPDERAARVVTHLDLGCEFRGGQRQVLYLAAEQVRAGLKVRLAAPAGSPILDRASGLGLPVFDLPGRRDFDPRNLAALARSLAPGEILHTHDARAASLGALVRLVRPGVRLVHTRRVSYPLGRGWSSMKYRVADLVACVSREVEDAVRAAGATRTAVIPSAIVLDRYGPRLGGNGGRLGIIGALSPQKGHAQFFEALSRMSEIPEVWVVGAGDLEGELKALAARLGLGERIHWKGEVESPRVLPHLDVLVVPSAHGEGSSGVVKEGWASGVPVVCSDLPANLELVRDGENGLVFPCGDPAALAQCLERLLGDSGLGERLAARGLADVRAYGDQDMRAAYDRVYAALGMNRAPA
jgi:glycosyltransferase involved in cell wall biosynthesis